MWCESGQNVEDDKGSVMMILRSLYRLNSAGKAWRAMLDRVIEKMGFKLCSQANANVYIRKEKKKNGDLYYM